MIIIFHFIHPWPAVSCVSYISTSVGFCLSFTVLLSLVFLTSTPVQVFVCRSLYCCLLCFLHQHQCRFLFVVHCTAVPCVSYISTSVGFRLSFTVLLSLVFLTSTPVWVFVCRSLYCCLLCFLHQHQCRFLFVVHCTAVPCVSYISTSVGFRLSFTVLLSLVFLTSTPVQVFVCSSLYCCLLCFLHQHQCGFLFVVHCTAVSCVSYINTSVGFRLSFTVLLSLVFLTSAPVQVFVCRSLYCCLLCFLHQHQCRFLFVVHCTAVSCVSYISTSAGFCLSFTVLLSLVFPTSTPVQVFVCRSLYCCLLCFLHQHQCRFSFVVHCTQHTQV